MKYTVGYLLTTKEIKYLYLFFLFVFVFVRRRGGGGLSKGNLYVVK